MLSEGESQTLLHISRAESTEFLRALVRLPSSESETAVADLVADRLRAEGIEVERRPFADGRENVLARLGPTGGPRLIMASHHDTMPVGDATTWKYPPFDAVLEGDRVYGRGASDDKSGVAAMVVALIALKRASVELAGEILFISVGGESIGNRGMLALVDEGLRADFAIVGEYSEADRIATTYRGVIWGELTVTGRSAHPGRPERGSDALAAALDVYLPVLRSHTFLYQQHSLVPDPTLTITRVASGHAVNAIADRCVATFDIRLVPGQSAAAVWKELEQAVASVATGDEHIHAELAPLHTLDGFETPVTNAYVEVLAQSVSALTGYPTVAMGKVGMCDANVLVHMAGVPSVAYGPGNPSGVGVDEFCDVDRLYLGARAYALAAPRILKEASNRG